MNSNSRGFTLIEVLVGLTVVSTLLTVVALALGELTRADRESRKRIDRQRAVHRIAVQLRQDLRQAVDCRLVASEAGSSGPTTDSPNTLSITTDAGLTIHFAPIAEGLVRTASRNEQQVHRERFACGARCRSEWTIDSSQALPSALLTLTFPARPQGTGERYQIRATQLFQGSGPWRESDGNESDGNEGNDATDATDEPESSALELSATLTDFFSHQPERMS